MRPTPCHNGRVLAGTDLRYIDPHNDEKLADEELLKAWLPVDMYIGGAEHAVLHLLYARFWHKFLYDIGVVPTKEPFQKLFNQGMILGTSYRDSRGAPCCDRQGGETQWVLLPHRNW